METLLSFLPRLWTNWITLLGAVITTVAAFIMILLVTMGIAAAESNVYASAFFFMVMPMLFVFGLILIPVGFAWERVRAPRAPDAFETAFINALRDRTVMRRVAFIGLATFVNVALLGIAGEKSIHFLDSPQFCGTACHTAMEPEWTAYTRSPHAHVRCVECHIGPGLAWELKAKMDGLRQVAGVITDNMARPIPSPLNHMRPSRDTCERCHWPQKFPGARVKLFPHYDPDEANTPKFNAMLLYVGGKNPQSGKYEGIHWHVSPEVRLKYTIRGGDRTKNGKIEVEEDGKLLARYEKALPGDGPLTERTMDCMDCHNRPTHLYDGAPKDAVDRAMYDGELDPSVPNLAKVAVDVLTQNTPPRAEAEAALTKALKDAYAAVEGDKPSDEALQKAGKGLAAIYLRNVFPEMKVTWNTYRANINHNDDKDEYGCFRCHNSDFEEKLQNGREPKLGQDCETCHATLASDESPENFDDTLKALVARTRN